MWFRFTLYDPDRQTHSYWPFIGQWGVCDGETCCDMRRVLGDVTKTRSIKPVVFPPYPAPPYFEEPTE